MEVVQTKERIKEMVKIVNITGLENAQIRVRSEVQKQHLVQVMENIQEKTKIKLNEMENLEFDVDKTGEVIVEGKKKAKFLYMFSMKHIYRCRITDNGLSERQKRWSDIFFKDLEEKICVV